MGDTEYVYVLHARSIEHTGTDAVIVEGIGENEYSLLACELPSDATVTPGDRVPITESAAGARIREHLDPTDLSQVARDHLEDAVTALVEANEDRFIAFFNTAEPLSLRRHQLDLLSGIAETRRNTILQEREHQSFTSFADLTHRVPGMPDPTGLLVERIVTELTTEDPTARVFVT